MKRIAVFLWFFFFAGGVLFGAFPAGSMADNKKLEILATTFPIYQITKNIVRDQEGVSVQLMIPSELGCPHDYALTPQDMQKLADADVLVVNGLGMEEFLGTPVEKANPNLKTIDSSLGIQDLLSYDSSEAGGEKHSGKNPHLFASPRMTARLAINIAQGLSMLDPSGKDRYQANAEMYATKMNRLADDALALGKRLKNPRIVTQHGVFDYLARDMGLQVVAVLQEHAGQEPSAADMLAVIQTIRREKAGGVFIEPQYPDAVGRTIASETKIPWAVLDPGASGPENAPLDYDEALVKTNLKTLATVLGVLPGK